MSEETRLSQELHRRADSVSGAPLTFNDVRGRARQIRRRRAASVVAGLAVVAAIVVPTALLSGSGHDRSNPPPAPQPTRAAQPDAIKVPFIQEGVLIAPDGPRFPLQLEKGETADGFAQLGTDRYVVSAQTDNGRRSAVLIDDAGRPLATYPLNAGLAAATNSSAVAWMDPDGRVNLLVAGADEAQVLASVKGTDPGAVAVVDDCSIECEVIVQIHGGRGLGPSYAVSTSGNVVREPDAVPSVVDVSPDGTLIAGIDGIAKDDVHACGGVYGVSSADFLWHGCEDNVFDFSPDGALIATTFSEGRGPTGVTIRDAYNGSPVNGLTDVGWVPGFAWEDSQHLLAVVVADDGSTSVVRVRTDGPAEPVLTGYDTRDEASIPVILPTVG